MLASLGQTNSSARPLRRDSATTVVRRRLPIPSFRRSGIDVRHVSHLVGVPDRSWYTVHDLQPHAPDQASLSHGSFCDGHEPATGGEERRPPFRKSRRESIAGLHRLVFVTLEGEIPAKAGKFERVRFTRCAYSRAVVHPQRSLAAVVPARGFVPGSGAVRDGDTRRPTAPAGASSARVGTGPAAPVRHGGWRTKSTVTCPVDVTVTDLVSAV
jgi:hypothetical protein